MADILIRGYSREDLEKAFQWARIGANNCTIELPPHGDLISRSDALAFPLANGKYDHENANKHFIYGCETYKEYLEHLPVIVPADKEETE